MLEFGRRWGFFLLSRPVASEIPGDSLARVDSFLPEGFWSGIVDSLFMARNVCFRLNRDRDAFLWFCILGALAFDKLV